MAGEGKSWDNSPISQKSDLYRRKADLPISLATASGYTTGSRSGYPRYTEDDAIVAANEFGDKNKGNPNTTQINRDAHRIWRKKIRLALDDARARTNQ